MAIMTLVECGRNDSSDSTLATNIEHGKLQRTFVFGVGAALFASNIAIGIHGVAAGVNAQSIPANGNFNAPGAQDLTDTLNAIVGNTAQTVNAFGQLNRTLPMSDPMLPNWFAQSVDKLQGVGQGRFVSAVETSQDDYIVPSLSAGFLLYPTYYVTVTFSQLSYAVFEDKYVPTGPSSWFLPYLDANSNPINAPYNYAREWQRFCTYDSEATNDYVVSNTGNMVFREQTVAGKPNLNNVPFSGPPRILLPNDLITFKWYAVPFRYITSPNSYIRRYRGHINQFDFWETPTVAGKPGDVSYVFPKGTLLYLSYKYTPFNPPIPQSSAWVPTLPNTAVPAKLVNIEFTCLNTIRFTSGVPVVPYNPNWITAGHNLLPSFSGNRDFHYATCFGFQVAFLNDQLNPSGWVPSFKSFPFELCFFDPDF